VPHHRDSTIIGNVEYILAAKDWTAAKAPGAGAMARLSFRANAAVTAALWLASITVFGSPCTPPPQLQAKPHPTADDYAALGDYFGNQGDYQCAAQALTSALKLQPRSAKFLYMLGLSYYSAGDAAQAVPALQKSIQLNPRALQSHLLLAAALGQLHRNPEAAAEWRAALDIDPNSNLALDGLAKSFLASNNYPAVVQLLRLVPRDENLALDLAIAYDRMGKVDEAAATLSEALAASPSSLQLANSLALIYLRHERHEDALHLLEKQYALHPDDLETQVDYFRVLVINEDRDKALPFGKTLLARAPHNFDVLYLNGMLERESGDYAAARDHLEEAIQLNPNHANCRYNLGVALARLNQPADARDQFEKAIELGWGGPEIYYELANIYRALGNSEMAAQQMKLYQQASKAKTERTLAAAEAARANQQTPSAETTPPATH